LLAAAADSGGLGADFRHRWSCSNKAK
jgi:hypothetical protein